MAVPMTVTKGNEADINATNVWMRSQPWYQQLLTKFNQDPNNVHLTSIESRQILDAAKANGVNVNEGNIEVDPSGNFNPKGHKLRNGLIAAALGGGAAFAAPAVLGAFGAAGGGSAAAGSTAALGPVAAAGGTTAAAVPGALAGVGGSTGVLGTAGSVLSRFANPNVLGAVGKAVGAATETQAQNRGNALEAQYRHDLVDLQGRQDNRAGETDAMKKLAQANYIQHWTQPTRPANLPTYGFAPQAPSDAQVSASKLLEQEMLRRLGPGGSFTATDPSQYTSPSGSERVGNYVGPALSIGSLLLRGRNG